MVRISICVGSSCHLKGSYQVIQRFQELIKKNKLENKVELKASFCLGRCTKGVAVKIDEEFVDELTMSNAESKFQEYVYKKVMP